MAPRRHRPSRGARATAVTLGALTLWATTPAGALDHVDDRVAAISERLHRVVPASPGPEGPPATTSTAASTTMSTTAVSTTTSTVPPAPRTTSDEAGTSAGPRHADEAHAEDDEGAADDVLVPSAAPSVDAPSAGAADPSTTAAATTATLVEASAGEAPGGVTQVAGGDADATSSVDIVQALLLMTIDVVDGDEQSTAGAAPTWEVLQMAHAVARDGAQVSIAQAAALLHLGHGITRDASGAGAATATGLATHTELVQLVDLVALGGIGVSVEQLAHLVQLGFGAAAIGEGAGSASAGAVGNGSRTSVAQLVVDRRDDHSELRQETTVVGTGSAAAAADGQASWADTVDDDEADAVVAGFLQAANGILGLAGAHIDGDAAGWAMELDIFDHEARSQPSDGVSVLQRITSLRLTFRRLFQGDGASSGLVGDDPTPLDDVAELEGLPAPAPVLVAGANAGGAPGDATAAGWMGTVGVCQRIGAAPACAPDDDPPAAPGGVPDPARPSTPGTRADHDETPPVEPGADVGPGEDQGGAGVPGARSAVGTGGGFGDGSTAGTPGRLPRTGGGLSGLSGAGGALVAVGSVLRWWSRRRPAPQHLMSRR